MRGRRQRGEGERGGGRALIGSGTANVNEPQAARPGTCRRRHGPAAIVAGTWIQRLTPPAVTGVMPVRSSFITGWSA